MITKVMTRCVGYAIISVIEALIYENIKLSK